MDEQLKGPRDQDPTVSYFNYVSCFAAKCQLLKSENQQYDSNALDHAVKDVLLNTEQGDNERSFQKI